MSKPAHAKGFRFYLEPKNADGSRTVIALQNDTLEGYVGVYGHENTGTNWGGVSADYLRQCVRISYAQAARRHPRLVERMEADKEA